MNKDARFRRTDGWLGRLSRQAGRGIVLLLLLSVALAGVMVANQTATAQEREGFEYTVQVGDNWFSVATRVGLTVSELQAANPQAMRRTGWLIIGEKLFVPAQLVTSEQIHLVQYGESWNSIAIQYGVSARLLRGVNPNLVRANLTLYRGDELLIPTEAQAPQGTTESTAPPATPAAVPAPSTATPTAASAATVDSTAAAAIVCPVDFGDYPTFIGTVLNDQREPAVELDGAQLLRMELLRCGIMADDLVEIGDLTGDGADDVLVIYSVSDDQALFPQHDLAIYNRTADGFELAYRAKAAGKVELLSTADLNQDQQPDVSWTDTTCGASTCFTTVNVRSWDGAAWQDWTIGNVTMAAAEITLAAAGTAGQGQALLLSGGLYGSVGAGPQRTRTETWVSVDGAPYSLSNIAYAPSSCLYHAVLDANMALLQGSAEGFAAAEAGYTRVLTADKLETCWIRPQEGEELRSFSLFRLALTAAYVGDASGAAAYIAQLGTDYPESTYAQIGDYWLRAYQASTNAAMACQATTDFVQAQTEAWEILDDYGYANPGFSAADVCPVLDGFLPSVSFVPIAGGGSESEQISATLTITVSEPSGAATPAQGSGESATAAAAPTATPAPTLPDCPARLADYADVLPEVIRTAGGDPLIVETWMRLCDAMTDERGAFLTYDLNRDGVPDYIVFPVLISDAGYGPAGAQGAVLVFYSSRSGQLTLAVSPRTLGEPQPLGLGDLNLDGRPDLAWTVTGCGTFCVTEVKMLSWSGETYTNTMKPGAIIAEGTVSLRPVAAGEPGQGQQVVLTGGVSGLARGGLAVPHTEIWASVAGAAYSRLSWTYDREVEDSACLGLRLVEADVALQAAALQGYEPAIQLYQQMLADPLLVACSLFGTTAEGEIALLRGLATFRLVQTLSLNGKMVTAQAILDDFGQEQPDSRYLEVAKKWLAEYTKAQDGTAACDLVQPILDEHKELWQITDNFGIDHPALGTKQICFRP